MNRLTLKIIISTFLDVQRAYGYNVKSVQIALKLITSSLRAR